MNNFQPYKLVGPSQHINATYMIGLTVSHADGWAVVFWGNGIINKHRIGSCGIYELVYLDFI